MNHNLIVINLILAVLYVIELSSTKGYVKAKILHTICLAFLFYNHLHSFQGIMWLIKSPGLYKELNIQVGIISGEINLVQNLIHILLGAIVVILAFGMLFRNDFSRRVVIWVLPLLIPTGTIAFYIDFNQYDLISNDYTIFFIGFMIFSFIYLGITLLYRSKFMKVFFYAKKLNSRAE